MLDEIINYVQSLQNQVEVMTASSQLSILNPILAHLMVASFLLLQNLQFLSMKLACVNPMLNDLGLDYDCLLVNRAEVSITILAKTNEFRLSLNFLSSLMAQDSAGVTLLTAG
ncbi:hypothetical protein HPP92_025299 [Vanilla planifolia]|uniref:Uncharacterized protein n=1 Tax=Vanilla planifolia TaxID=51239 RepID=A0A835U986_VANPL|nr:hypothetical protein HPP92_025299 [Vanilla planifolia]